MRRNRLELINKNFGRLVVVSFSHVDSGKNSHWDCVCDCGKLTTVRGSHLKNGATKSCGCLRSEVVSSYQKTHGKSFTKTYISWSSMKRRCNNKNSIGYKNWGGRGIKYCKEWNVFENFHKDMGDKPGKNYSLDRIDNNKGYSKDNCRWATRKEQNRNRRDNILHKYNGKSRTLTEISELTGIKRATIWSRINILGWTLEEALNTLVRGLNKNKMEVEG